MHNRENEKYFFEFKKMLSTENFTDTKSIQMPLKDYRWFDNFQWISCINTLCVVGKQREFMQDIHKNHSSK